ncbi:uncharacterized protein [Branchiostoma lanceolatum]|uniref:uncharacterized protein n=1 Tax=Branchiostoma lanceolatum TaxID=7740 RepID=UPI003452D25B
MSIDFKSFKLLLCVILAFCCIVTDVFGRSVPRCEGGKVWNDLRRVCECPQWMYWYEPTHGCEPCSLLCRGEVSHCEARIECQGYLQSLISTRQPASTQSSWTIPPASQISELLTELKTWELAVIFIGAVLLIVVFMIICMGWTLCKLKKQISKNAGINAHVQQPIERQSIKDLTIAKQRYEPDGALPEEARRSTCLQPDTQETEELLSHGAQCAHVVTSPSPSDHDVRHSPTSDTELHKPSVNEHGDILQQHHYNSNQ